MVKAYLVFGGEACGNHLATNLLIWAGVTRGTTTNDIINPEKLQESQLPVVFRRSAPHGGEWAKIDYFTKRMLEPKDIKVIVPVRNWECAIKSSLMRGHSKTKAEAIDKLKRAYKHIFEQITKHNLDYVMFSYDECTRNPVDYLKEFYKSLDITIPELFILGHAVKVTNENEKFYNKDYKAGRPTDGY